MTPFFLVAMIVVISASPRLVWRCRSRGVRSLVLALFDAGIRNGHLAVLAQCVVGLAELEATLEAMVKPCNLVPVAEILVQIQSCDGSVIHLLCIAATGKQESNKSCKGRYMQNARVFHTLHFYRVAPLRLR